MILSELILNELENTVQMNVELLFFLIMNIEVIAKKRDNKGKRIKVNKA